jgi:hypothetical protein
MLDFTSIREKTKTIAEFVTNISVDDLRAYSNEAIDTSLKLIADCTDADVVFVPSDPAANDTYAAPGTDVNLAWTLGHVIVHLTASSEESAFLGAEQARGVENHGRSRYETPWETVTTIAQCRQRLEESRRIRLASLGMWPDAPHLETTVELGFLAGPINPVARFVVGLMHEYSHFAQVAEIVRQAKAAR